MIKKRLIKRIDYAEVFLIISLGLFVLVTLIKRIDYPMAFVWISLGLLLLVTILALINAPIFHTGCG